MNHEEQMIQDVLNGNAESFRWIIERYQRPVHRMVFNLTHDSHIAEDITQEVFLAVFQKLSTFDPMRCKFSTWIFTIARNKSINHLRKKKNELEMRDDVSFDAEPSEDLCQKEFARQMDRALSSLPGKQKNAFVLAQFEKLPYDQIAQIECVSIGTVRSRIHRAKRKLRKAFKKIDGDEK